jgi:hypothetical protein
MAQQDKESYKFYGTKTMSEFMSSPAHVRVLAGPIGGGKSVCCAHELMRWAMLQEPNEAGIRKTRFLVVRNTVDQLRSTTLKTIVDWFPPAVFGRYMATEKTLYYKLKMADGTRVETEWMLIALDTPDDVRKALSLECTGLWGNESRELHPEVVDGLLMRVDRYPSMREGGATRAGAIFDTNMPGEDTWWEKQMSESPENWSIHIQPPAVLPVKTWIDKHQDDPPPEMCARDNEGTEYVVDPDCDNYSNLGKGYYVNTLQGKAPDFVNVYLRCQFGRTLSGLPVYDQTFRADAHIANTYLNALRSDNYPLLIGLDFGRTPAALIGQPLPNGRVQVLSEVIGQNMGIQTFATKHLRPHLWERYPGMPVVMAPDPAGQQKTQIGETSPWDYLKKAGFTLIKPTTNKVKLRIEAVDALLMASTDAQSRLIIDPRCKTLIKGFRGGYKWAVNKRGDLTNDTEPMKNAYSHIHDALQYFALVVDSAHYHKEMRAKRPVKVAKSSGWT